MDTRNPIEKFEKTLSSLSRDMNPETKLSRLEEAACDPEIRELFISSPKHKQAFQSAYAACAREFAAELSGFSRHIFAGIDQLDNVEVKKQKYGYKIPLSHRMITNSFNILAQHVTRSIVTEESINKRTLIMERWINIAQRCFDEKDFNTCFSIMAGLGSTPVFRLKATQDGLSENAVRFLEIFRPLLANADAVTMLMSRTGTDIIPYYGTYRTTLTFTLDKIDSAQRKRDLPALQAEESVRDQLLARLERIRSYQASINTIHQTNDMTPLQAMLFRKAMLQIMNEIAEEKRHIEEELRHADAEFKQVTEVFTHEKGPFKTYLMAMEKYDKSKKEEKDQQVWKEEQAKFQAEKQKMEIVKKNYNELMSELMRKRENIHKTYQAYEEMLKTLLKEAVQVERASPEAQTEKDVRLKKMAASLGADKIDDTLSKEVEPRDTVISASRLFDGLQDLVNAGISRRINEASLIIDCVNIMKESSTTTNNMRGVNIKLTKCCDQMKAGEIQDEIARLNDEIEQVRLFVLDAKRNVESHLASGHKMQKDERMIETIMEKLQGEYFRLQSRLHQLESMNNKVDQESPDTGEAIKLLHDNIQNLEKMNEIFLRLSEPLIELNIQEPMLSIGQQQVRRPMTVRLNEPVAFPAWMTLDKDSRTESAGNTDLSLTESTDSLVSEGSSGSQIGRGGRDRTRRYALNLSDALMSQHSPLVTKPLEHSSSATQPRPVSQDKTQIASPKVLVKRTRKFPNFPPPPLPGTHPGVDKPPTTKARDDQPVSHGTTHEKKSLKSQSLIEELRQKQASRIKIAVQREETSSDSPQEPPKTGEGHKK